MRVLLIDDDANVRKAVRLMLEDAASEVVEADSRRAANAYRESGADLVLCDLFMPGKDGIEVIRELRRDFPAVKVVAMSGGGFDGTVDMLPVARKLGAAEVLHKPFGPAALLAAIERVVQPRSAG